MKIVIENHVAEYVFYSAKREILCTPEHFCAFAMREGVQITVERSAKMLQEMCGEGFLRPLQIEGHGRKIYFQPTSAGAQYRGKNVPRFVRSGLSQDVRRRAALRANVIFSSPSAIDWLGVESVDELLKTNNCGQNGFSRPLVGEREGAKLELVFCILPHENERQVIESTIFRLLNLLESGVNCALRFACTTQNQDRVTQSLALLTSTPGSQIQQQIDAIDVQIADDKTGFVALELAAKRRKLVEQLGATPEEQPYPWLSSKPIVV